MALNHACVVVTLGNMAVRTVQDPLMKLRTVTHTRVQVIIFKYPSAVTKCKTHAVILRSHLKSDYYNIIMYRITRKIFLTTAKMKQINK